RSGVPGAGRGARVLCTPGASAPGAFDPDLARDLDVDLAGRPPAAPRREPARVGRIASRWRGPRSRRGGPRLRPERRAGRLRLLDGRARRSPRRAGGRPVDALLGPGDAL